MNLRKVTQVPVRETALYRASLLEIKRLEAENRRLRARLHDPAKEERTLDLRSEYMRGDLEDETC